MLGDAIGYPARDENPLATVLIGGLLALLSVLLGIVGMALAVVVVGLLVLPLALVPAIVLWGYYVAVLRAVTDGDPEPPRFREWRRLFGDGLRYLAVTAVYALPVAALWGLFLGIVAASETVAGSETATVAVTVAAVVVGAIACASLFAVAYLRPLALANLAREDSLRAAFDPGALRTGGLSRAYAVAWATAAVIRLVAWGLQGSLAIVLAGFFLGFYADVARYYCYGRGLLTALEGTPPERAADVDAEPEPGSDRDGDPGRSIDPTVLPVLEDREAYLARTRAVDEKRGWPDWDTGTEE